MGCLFIRTHYSWLLVNSLKNNVLDSWPMRPYGGNDDTNGKMVKSNTSVCNNRLFCSQCNRVIEFMHPMAEKLQREVCEQHEFTLKSSMTLFSGVCRGCLLQTGLISKSI